MLAFLVGIITLGITGCQVDQPFIQVNLGPASSGSMRRPMMRPPQMRMPQNGGYPVAGGDGGYYNSGYQQPYGQPYGYGQPSYGSGYGNGCRQPYRSNNMLMRYGNWIPQEALRQSQYFMPRYPNGFMRGSSSGCHRQPPPPPRPPRPHPRHHT